VELRKLVVSYTVDHENESEYLSIKLNTLMQEQLNWFIEQGINVGATGTNGNCSWHMEYPEGSKDGKGKQTTTS
jgi:hypothetical protein